MPGGPTPSREERRVATADEGLVAVCMGGTAAERPVSLKSGAAVLAALTRQGVHAVGVTLDQDDCGALPAETTVAFLALHGGFGEDGRIQSALDARGIPYTGSGPAASRLAMDKLATGRRLHAAGLAVPKAVAAWAGARRPSRLDAVGVPCVVKPRREGSSLGVSVVRSEADLSAALGRAWQYGPCALVERFVAGTELTVGVLEGRALPPVEVLPRDEFFSYDAKYGGPTTYLVDPPLPVVVREAVRRTGEAAYHALGCRHYARVDMIVRPTGVPVVLEVNTLPGFTDRSLFPMAAGAAGITFDALCLRLLALARTQRGRRQSDRAA